MTHVASRLLSTVTAAYAVYSLVRPEHLGRAMQADARQQPSYDGYARAYGVRDLVIGGLGAFGRSRGAVRAAMGLRIAGDITDCVILVQRADDRGVKLKVAAVTLGYAAMNVAALLADERRAA
jgi:hypothetical protein